MCLRIARFANRKRPARKPTPCIAQPVPSTRSPISPMSWKRKGRFGLTRSFIQHGTMSVHAHVISVARASLAMAGRLERTGDPHRSRFAHPRRAPSRLLLLRLARPRPIASPAWVHAPIRRARPRGRGLRRPDRRGAQHHLPALSPAGSHPSDLPRNWSVRLADKACALHETIAGRLPKRSTGRKEVSR